MALDESILVERLLCGTKIGPVEVPMTINDEITDNRWLLDRWVQDIVPKREEFHFIFEKENEKFQRYVVLSDSSELFVHDRDRLRVRITPVVALVSK